jgi:hypothetical protein
VLFLLLSGFFLAALIGAVERSRKLLGVAGACLVVIVSIIVFVKPVQLPSFRDILNGTTTTTISAAKPGVGGSAGAAIGAPAPGTTTTAPAASAGSAGSSTTTTTAPGAAAAPGSTEVAVAR